MRSRREIRRSLGPAVVGEATPEIALVEANIAVAHGALQQDDPAVVGPRLANEDPPSEKAQLFKAARVIQKSFNAEADVLSRTRAARDRATVVVASDRRSRQGPNLQLRQQMQQMQQRLMQQRRTTRTSSPPRMGRAKPSSHRRQREEEDKKQRTSLDINLNRSKDSDFELDASAA